MYIYKKSKIINKLSEYGRATKLRDIITIYIYIPLHQRPIKDYNFKNPIEKVRNTKRNKPKK